LSHLASPRLVSCYSFYILLFFLPAGAQEQCSLALLPAPTPALFFDTFLSSLLSSLYFLPLFLPLSFVHWLADHFNDLDGCVWAAVLR
jgi:hypothetical protein